MANSPPFSRISAESLKERMQAKEPPILVDTLTKEHLKREMASFGPARCSHSLEILAVAPLRLRLPNRCGLGLNQKLPSLDGH